MSDGVPRPEDWLASTTTAYNGSVEIEGEGLGRSEDGRLVRDIAGTLPILVKLLDSDERLVIQAHPTVPFARARMNSPVGKTECWYFLPGTAPDAYAYDGLSIEETCAKYVRRGADIPVSEPAARILGPDMTDKFEMWRLNGGGALPMDGRSAVVVVTDGEGSLNGGQVSKGDRLLVCGEQSVSLAGTAVAVVCR